MNADIVHRLGAPMCAAAGVLWLLGAAYVVRQRLRARRRLHAALAGTAREGPGFRGGSGAAAWPRGRGGGGSSTRPRGGGGPLEVRPGGHRTGSNGGRTGSKRTSRPVVPGQHKRAAAIGRSAGQGGVARHVLVRGAVRRWLPVAGVVCAGYVLVGGLLGGLLGVLGGGAVGWWQCRRPPAGESDKDRAVLELPLAADLLAACITAGADPVTAARVVGESLDGPVGERLARGAAEVRLGGEPAEAWRRLAAIPGAAPLARLLQRAGESGAPAAAPVARLAGEARADRGRTATARARRAGVLITAPVGLCFLPAFIAVGVLPVVIGLAGTLLNGGGG